MKGRQRFFDPDDLHLTIARGRACHFIDHGATLTDDQSFRYTDTHACTHCITALTRPGVSIDINRIRPDRIRHFLRFWTMVDIRGEDECWTWSNPHDTAQRCARIQIPYSGKFEWVSPSRAAIWFSWGDTGLLPYRRSCDTTGCCNPLHLRVTQVPHFVYRRSIDLIDLRRDARKLEAHRHAFTRSLIETDSPRLETIRRVNPDWVSRVARTVLAEEPDDSRS